MQILLNGIRLNTERLHKYTNGQLNQALGKNHNPAYTTKELANVTREHLEKDVLFEVEQIRENNPQQKGRRPAASTTEAAAKNKAYRIKKGYKEGKITLERAKYLIDNDLLLQKFINIEELQ